ncbi:rhodanese-like domain-containing protein [Maridesulfovibrio bastinii]|uniref:rhodanese-like domain-containing protein n=1 Tax=Maridesulfovibrio bastinii TaxID=47157 RepID=UPI000428E04E|nr:rhodanese-like domain-containing protein [Maridesulfovibrio bastinii]
MTKNNAAQASETAQEQLLRINREVLSVPHTFFADSLYEALLTEGNSSFFIISLQNEEEFNEGHIPGAVRFQIDLSRPEKALKSLPADKTIVVTDSNGQLSCRITTFLRQMGVNAKNLLVGLEGWNKKYSGAGAYCGGVGLPVSDVATPLPVNDIPYSAPSGLSDKELILKRTVDYASQGRPAIISPEEALNMSNSFTISMQAEADYAFGHIDGAANLPVELFLSGSPELLKLPFDKKIIVGCYMGHYSNIGSLILNQLGYEAYSLDWGLAGWNTDGFERPLQWLQGDNEYPVEKGS